MRQSNRSPLLTFVSWATIWGAFGILMYLAYILFFPFQILEIKDQPMPLVSGNTYHIGDTVRYQLNYCKYMDVPAEITYQLVDGQVISFPKVGSKLKNGCKKVISSSVKIPKGVYDETDPYKITATVEYKIHPLRTVTYEFETEQFYIKP